MSNCPECNKTMGLHDLFIAGLCPNCAGKYITKQDKRIVELEAALQGMVLFIEEDFPNGTGTNHGTCATDQYQQACDAVIQALKS